MSLLSCKLLLIGRVVSLLNLLAKAPVSYLEMLFDHVWMISVDRPLNELSRFNDIVHLESPYLPAPGPSDASR